MKSILIFISSILISFLYPIYNIGIKKVEIDNIIEVIPNKLVDDNVIEIVKDDINIKYIVKYSFENDLKEYLNLILKNKIEKYYISFLYFIKNDNGYFLDMSEYSKNVQVDLKMDVHNFYTLKYEKVFMVI